MNWALLVVAAGALVTALLIWVEERMERRRRIRRQLRIIERYGTRVDKIGTERPWTL